MRTRGYHGRTAIASAGATEYSQASDHSVLELAVRACEDALSQAGMSGTEIDGIVSYSLYSDSTPAAAVGACLGATSLDYLLDANAGGQTPSLMVMHAAMAVHMGLARNVLVFRALKGRSGLRVGHFMPEGGSTDLRYVVGLTAYPQYAAMWLRRYMIETQATEEDVAAVPIVQRRYAALNPRALLRSPLTLDDYMKSKWVVEPLRRADCTIEVDGAAAVLVTSTERARDLKLPPAIIQGSAWAARDLDLDMGSTLRYRDYSRTIAYDIGRKLWQTAGLEPKDVDVAELYDCFSSLVLSNLEGYGFCEYGEAGSFIRSGATWMDGRLPVNTSGGLLCEGYLHGMNTIAEGVWQIQGLCGERQIADAKVAMVCSGGRNAGSALVLARG